MDVAVQDRPMTEAEFLAWSETVEDRRFEFDGRFAVLMVGSTLRHGVIQTNLLVALRVRLRGTACTVLGSDNFVRAEHSLRLPDALVATRDVQDEGRVLPDPAVVFEILSDSTERTDRTLKTREYWANPSIQHCVLLEQHAPVVEVLTRGAEGWIRTAATSGETVALPAIGIELPVDELYEGLRFPQPPKSPPA